ncbi:ABC transporter substrate binding protein [Candidatus Brocadiaceae bacterium S225]|nr:ABC transporter substrate binding protein [Candidatus Brocadiaceae bacterium S225]
MFSAFIALTLLFSNTVFAIDNGKVVVLDTDMTIGKYVIVHEVFKSKIANIADEIYLGSKSINKRKIKKKIRQIDPDVVYCIGSRAYQLAHDVTKNVDLVFSSAINYHRFPMRKNTYGISNELPQKMQMMMFRYFFPDIEKIGVLYSKTYNKEWLDTAIENAGEVNIEIIGTSIKKPKELSSALEALMLKVDALWLLADPVVLSNEESITKIFKKSKIEKIPVFTYNNVFAKLGATMIISADIPTIGLQAADMVLDRLANKAITQRVQPPAGSYIILNLKKVEEYGLNLNDEALDSVNEIIR